MTSYVCYNNNRGNLEIEVQLAQKGRKDLVADQNEDLRDVRFFSENLFLLVTMPKEIKRLHLVYIYLPQISSFNQRSIDGEKSLKWSK